MAYNGDDVSLYLQVSGLKEGIFEGHFRNYLLRHPFTDLKHAEWIVK